MVIAPMAAAPYDVKFEWALGLSGLLPEILLVITALAVVLIDLVIHQKRLLFGVALAGLMLALFAAALYGRADASLFGGLLALDSFAVFFKLLAIGSMLLVVLCSVDCRALSNAALGEYIALLLFATVAMLTLISANDLLTVFLGVEFLSLTSYVLVGFLREEPLSSEAALKYFLFGAFCSGTMLYGMSLLYGLAGTTHLPDLKIALASRVTAAQLPVVWVSFLLVLVGLGFKIAIVPLHLWVPDVYEGAPTPITAFLSVGSKVAAFAVLFRFFRVAMPLPWNFLDGILGALCILTMTTANLVALKQGNIKRLLGYSSIAQMGTILIGFVVATLAGMEAVLLYLLAYLFMNLGAFLIVIWVSNAGGSDAIDDFAGLSKTSPVLAMMLALFLLSLVGVPPLAGFFGKFFIFAAAMKSGYLYLAIAGVINAVIAAGYYFKVIYTMYLVEPRKVFLFPKSLSLKVGVAVSAVGTLAIGIFPRFILEFVSHSTKLLGWAG